MSKHLRSLHFLSRDEIETILELAKDVKQKPEEYVHTRKELEKRGIDVVRFEMPELIGGSGGPRCMTMPILRQNNA